MTDYNIEGVKLGQAQKQASNSLKGIIIFSDIEKVYKERTRLFFQWNSELEAELLNKKVEEEKVSQSVSKPQPSVNQKYCPKCKAIIPKTWTNHKAVCGWTQ